MNTHSLSPATALLIEQLGIAPAGFSEHHTGRAVDVTSVGCPMLDVAFEETPAFAWLTRHACDFGFSLSCPHGNSGGYQYESWHWCFGGGEERA